MNREKEFGFYSKYNWEPLKGLEGETPGVVNVF